MSVPVRHRRLVSIFAIPVLAAPLAAQGEDPPTPQDPGRRTAPHREQHGHGTGAFGEAAPTGRQHDPIRLTDLSLNILGAVGASTERDAVLEQLQGGGHDPRKRGFTLQQAALAIAGAVDPWFTAQAHLVAFIDPIEGETVFELEEAFAKSSSLPADLQLKVGHYLTEFGRVNAQHPHEWDWQDQPIIVTRLLGPDGMRGPGASVSWPVRGDTFTGLTFGVQNANGETMASFAANDEFYAERPVGGRSFVEVETRSMGDMVWTARAAATLDLGGPDLLGFGMSAAFGPNATGSDGDTLIWGADFKYRRPGEDRDGLPSLLLQGELLGRAFDADDQVDENDPLDPGDDVAVPGGTLDDVGFYLQGLCGLDAHWAVGLRGEWATGSGASYDAANDAFGRDFDAFRTDRLRLSPLLVYQPGEFSRFRLQYNYDDSDHLAEEAHSVWLGFEVLIGAHPPHRF